MDAGAGMRVACSIARPFVPPLKFCFPRKSPFLIVKRTYTGRMGSILSAALLLFIFGMAIYLTRDLD